MTPYRVGLTGGIAAGKSTVASWLRQAGLPVVDADTLVAHLYLPGGDGALAVERLFGPSFLLADRSVDHRRLAALIFEDPAARRQLEEVIHPLVRRDFEEVAGRENRIVILEAPLLVEAGFVPDFDLIVTVEAAPETRIDRAVARGLERAEARERLAAQTDEATRTQVAHKILRNDGSLDDLRLEVDKLIGEIRRRAEGDRG